MRDLQRQERDGRQAAKPAAKKLISYPGSALACRREGHDVNVHQRQQTYFAIMVRSTLFFSQANRESFQGGGLLKRALVCGAGGFIGGHLVKKLKRAGYWVRGVDIKVHEFCPSGADEFLLLDLRRQQDCKAALTVSGGQLDEVYQLAADMGGMGFIHS